MIISIWPVSIYMEYNEDLVRHSLRKYWYEIGTKLVRSLTIAVRKLYENCRKLSKIAALRAAGDCIC